MSLEEQTQAQLCGLRVDKMQLFFRAFALIVFVSLSVVLYTLYTERLRLKTQGGYLFS
jgi:hypothetical protein